MSIEKNSFMKFNPSEKNKHYKMLDETGFYRSTIDHISQYFNKWDEMLRQRSMTPLERDVWLFAMYYDFMSYVAQNLRAMYETGKSIMEGRFTIKEVIMECSSRFTLSQEEVVMTMLAIANESYPPACL